MRRYMKVHKIYFFWEGRGGGHDHAYIKGTPKFERGICKKHQSFGGGGGGGGSVGPPNLYLILSMVGNLCKNSLHQKP